MTTKPQTKNEKASASQNREATEAEKFDVFCRNKYAEEAEARRAAGGSYHDDGSGLPKSVQQGEPAKPSGEHSPLPWHIAEYGIKELKAKYLCIKHGSKTIARIDASGNSLSVTKQDEANARLIVASANHAQALADALRLIAADNSTLSLREFKDLSVSKAKQALAAWKGAQS